MHGSRGLAQHDARYNATRDQGEYRRVDNLPTLMRELHLKYADDVPLDVLEAYCKRYLHYYHQYVEHQPERFYGAWGWSEARRREFRKAFDARPWDRNANL